MTITPAIRRHFARMVKVLYLGYMTGPYWIVKIEGSRESRHDTRREARLARQRCIRRLIDSARYDAHDLRARGFKVIFAP